MSASRPAAPLVAVSTDASTSQRDNLLWGVVPATVASADLEDTRALARSLAIRHQLAVPGQRLLLVRGFSRDPARNAPSVTVVTV